ncbi:MAG TPA: HAD family phosphatase [Mycobacteriales bacterium]|nr:HAD family phosphatase [Mycobacteriales bacterium]
MSDDAAGSADHQLRALIVDYGGVLTSPLQDTMRSWCEDDEIDLAAFRRVMREWLGSSYGAEAATNPMHALERGELAIPDFERELASRLHTHDGRPVQADGLLARMFAGFRREQPMFDAVRRARTLGIRTALLSNSWGLDYPREQWDEAFDAVVISGEVGMRKPEPAIYRLAADKLGLEPSRCVFVDDLAPNVAGAVSVGMVGVQFTTVEQALGELETLFGVELVPA